MVGVSLKNFLGKGERLRFTFAFWKNPERQKHSWLTAGSQLFHNCTAVCLFIVCLPLWEGVSPLHLTQSLSMCVSTPTPFFPRDGSTDFLTQFLLGSTNRDPERRSQGCRRRGPVVFSRFRWLCSFLSVLALCDGFLWVQRTFLPFYLQTQFWPPCP